MSVTTAQGAIVGEKQLGTAAWILSKPVSRSAFVLAKFLAYAVSFVILALLLPSAIFYGQSLLLAGRAPELAPFLAAVGIVVIHTLFYLALTLLLGTLFNTRGPISGVAMGVLFAGFLPPNLLPQAAMLVLPGRSRIAWLGWCWVAHCRRSGLSLSPRPCSGQGCFSLWRSGGSAARSSRTKKRKT